MGNPTMDVRTLPAMEGLDLFAGCFQLAPFVCWDGGFKASCADDTRPSPSYTKRQIVRKYKPRIAVLLASDYKDLHPEQLHVCMLIALNFDIAVPNTRGEVVH